MSGENRQEQKDFCVLAENLSAVKPVTLSSLVFLFLCFFLTSLFLIKPTGLVLFRRTKAENVKSIFWCVFSTPTCESGL